jgi:Mg2+ and Co2+ transporter CorA
VKALTVLSVLLLPAGVVTNLAPLLVHSPAYDLGRAGFWLIILASMLVAFGGLLMARARRWL